MSTACFTASRLSKSRSEVSLIMTENPIKERLYVPRIFSKPRKDGRLGLFQIQIDSTHTNTIHTNTGATNKEGGITWHNQMDYPQKGKNVGRSNYKPPAQVAEEQYERIIKSKLREGYHEIVDEDELLEPELLTQVEEEIPFLLDLENSAPGFRPWKPQNRICCR